MTSKDYLDRLVWARQLLDRCSSIQAYAAIGVTTFEQLLPLLGSIARSGNDQNLLKRLQELFQDTIKRLLSGPKPFAISDEISLLASELGHSDPQREPLLHDVYGAARAVRTSLEAFLTQQNKQKAFDAAVDAYRLSRSISALNGATDSARAAMEHSWPQATDGERVLTLHLLVDDDLRQLADRLRDLADLYSILAELLGYQQLTIPAASYKVESGTIKIQFKGAEKVVDLIEWLIKSSLRFLHGQFTREGKIAKIPRTLDVLNDAARTYDTLRSLGLPVDEMGDQLAAAGVRISAHLNGLLDDIPAARVGGEKIELDIKLQEQLLIESRPQLMIGAGEPEAPTEVTPEEPEA